jgi:hypothetical protein
VSCHARTLFPNRSRFYSTISARFIASKAARQTAVDSSIAIEAQYFTTAIAYEMVLSMGASASLKAQPGTVA